MQSENGSTTLTDRASHGLEPFGPLIDLLNGVSADLLRQIIAHGDAVEYVFPGFRQRFVAPASTLAKIEFREIADGAAFRILPGSDIMEMNVGHAASIAQAAELDLDAMARAGKPSPDKGLVLRLAMHLLILHELRHSSQGVGDYADVQRLKRFDDGASVIGELDLLADCDAARAYAVLRMIEDGEADVRAYLTNLATALLFMGDYCFPAFKMPMSKPPKMRRALGLTLMLARISRAMEDDSLLTIHAGPVPLDTPLMPKVDLEAGQIAIFAYRNYLTLAAMGIVDPEKLEILCRTLDDGNFDAVVTRAVALLSDLGFQ